jgi:hypothetical protein
LGTGSLFRIYYQIKAKDSAAPSRRQGYGGQAVMGEVKSVRFAPSMRPFITIPLIPSK